MQSRDRRIARVLLPVAAAAALGVGAAAAAPPAGAHVHAASDNSVRGATAIVTFQVPNESSTGAATTALTVNLPNVAAASVESMPGWTAKLDRDAAGGTFRSVTWNAVAPNAGIGADQFALFRISVQLPDSETATFPATQTYSDGAVVKWDQPPLPGGGEPEHPAPMLTLAAAPAGHSTTAPQAKSADNAARVLGGAALAMAALGVGIALFRRRA
ncbi:YcnI family protein [Mycobacterium sp.]|uniref:YcnI family protein n=1 Tax=Mycobacterium sp. TaxID=1785 RepID=UPI0025D5CE3D|nr:YcnI family protein [Mycobacterium sp.]MBW0014201.1 YcnI family protein [Mycobacterium sp.]